MTEPNDIQTLHAGRHLRMVKRGSWEYVHRPDISGVVGIIPITDDNRIVFIQQHRPPLNNAVIE